jgi:hypothetical protein
MLDWLHRRFVYMNDEARRKYESLLANGSKAGLAQPVRHVLHVCLRVTLGVRGLAGEW